MYTINNLSSLRVNFQEINYTEKLTELVNNEPEGVKISFSVNGLRSEIGDIIRNKQKIYIIRNYGDILIDSDIFILKARFIATFDIIGVDSITEEKILLEESSFDNLILISIEEMRKEVNSKLNSLLEFTNFSPESKYEFWEKDKIKKYHK